MDQSLMILITGAPAAGKTTLSKNLSRRLGIPVIYKDEIKEILLIKFKGLCKYSY